MKKQYSVPETELVICRLEKNLLTSNYTSSSTDMTYRDASDDYEWDY